jgi:hypothetical protein
MFQFSLSFLCGSLYETSDAGVHNGLGDTPLPEPEMRNLELESGRPTRRLWLSPYRARNSP